MEKLKEKLCLQNPLTFEGDVEKTASADKTEPPGKWKRRNSVKNRATGRCRRRI